MTRQIRPFLGLVQKPTRLPCCVFSRATDRGTTPRVASEENGARCFSDGREPPLGFHPGSPPKISRVTGIIAVQWAKSFHSRPFASSSTAAILSREWFRMQSERMREGESRYMPARTRRTGGRKSWRRGFTLLLLLYGPTSTKQLTIQKLSYHDGSRPRMKEKEREREKREREKNKKKQRNRKTKG